MILGFDREEKLTPKQKAAELISFAVSKELEFPDTWDTYEEMTPREVEKVTEQLIKYQARIDKIIGYTR